MSEPREAPLPPTCHGNVSSSPNHSCLLNCGQFPFSHRCPTLRSFASCHGMLWRQTVRLGWGKSNFSAPSPRWLPFQPLCQISDSFIRAELHGCALLLCTAPTSTTSHLNAQHPRRCSRSHPSRAGHEAQTSTPSPSTCPPRCSSGSEPRGMKIPRALCKYLGA